MFRLHKNKKAALTSAQKLLGVENLSLSGATCSVFLQSYFCWICIFESIDFRWSDGVITQWSI
jgi:hypothetical protein